MRLLPAIAAALLAVAPAFAEPASNPLNVPEPTGLHQGSLHGYVPATLKGATVLDSSAALETVMRDSIRS